VLELRPAHDPTKGYGFVGVVTSTADLTASVWLWSRADDGTVSAEKVITIPPEPADADLLPELLKPFGAVPALITDISLSVDDRSLLVSCWGTGELKRFDVSDPRAPRETGSVRLGGIVERAPHPAAGPLSGGPQMVEVSRDGRRVYLTNSLYAAWDAQFYPNGIDGWLVKLDAGEDGSLTLDPDVYVEFHGERPHQVRLQGGDASSDSFCFPDR
jgi:selenium-binding protein 1